MSTKSDRELLRFLQDIDAEGGYAIVPERDRKFGFRMRQAAKLGLLEIMDAAQRPDVVFLTLAGFVFLQERDQKFFEVSPKTASICALYKVAAAAENYRSRRLNEHFAKAAQKATMDEEFDALIAVCPEPVTRCFLQDAQRQARLSRAAVPAEVSNASR